MGTDRPCEFCGRYLPTERVRRFPTVKFCDRACRDGEYLRRKAAGLVGSDDAERLVSLKDAFRIVRNRGAHTEPYADGEGA